jgi:uncharacterized protein
MAELTFMSADSHVMERGDLWVERLDRKFQDDAPRVIQNPDKNGPTWVFINKDLPAFGVAEGFSAGLDGKNLSEAVRTKGYKDARPGGWDPAERIKDQDIDGVVAEVMYPTLGMFQLKVRDLELQNACIKVYNTWAAEFCSYDPKRFLGISLISLEDVAQGVAELERCAKLGHKGAMICVLAPEGRPYHSPEYDPFWRAAAERDMPLTLHTGTAAPGSIEPRNLFVSERPGQWLLGYCGFQFSLTQFIFGGVLDRFPKLKIVSVENDVMWFRHFLYRADRALEHYSSYMAKPLSRKPSEYIRNQVFATFERDPMSAQEYQEFGASNFMWASDYPHGVSTWPHSKDIIQKNFAHVPADVTHKIVFENAANLYHVSN